MKANWQTKKLGEVCDIVNGGTPDTKIAEFWGGKILWITPKDMGKLDDIYVDDTGRKITDAGLKNSSAKILPINSIILSSRAPIGHLAINTKEIATNQGCKGIVPKKGLATLYLFYFMKNSVELLNSLGSGTTFKELSGSKLAEVQLPVPPLPEQYRIVAKLNKTFAAIAKAKENAEKNLANSKELFESYLNDVFAKPGKDWEEKEFEKGIEKIIYTNKVHKSKFLDAGKYPIISQEQEFINGFWNNHEDLFKVNKPVVIFGDHTQILKYIDFDFVLGADGVKILQPIKEINSKYFYYFIKNNKINNLGYARHYRLFKEITIPIAPQKEQHAIVAKLDALSAQTKKLEAIYTQKLADLEELKKSVLQMAFNGEL